MNRTDIINFFLSKKDSPKCYLEIGVRRLNRNFNFINADFKDGVDPDKNSECNNIMTSDEFFLKNSKTYDVIFIDGLHTFNQAYRDVINALKVLKKNGIILMHDCNPPTEWHQRDKESRGQWNGTTWKALVKLRMEHEDIKVYTVDTDFGIGIIVPNSSQKLFKINSEDNFFNSSSANIIINSYWRFYEKCFY